MSDHPAPLTPADCDLRGYDFMPLFGHRLFNSELYARASDAEFRAAMRIWWAAWQQCPAASLPDDDAVLCRMADFGRELKAWRKVRVMALRGFVLCSDGRLYHPVLAAEALKAWDRRVRDRTRKANWRQGQNADVPRDNEPASASRPTGQDAGRDGDVRADRTGHGQDIDRTEEKNPPPPRSRGAGSAGLRPAEIDDAFETWWVNYPRKVGRGAARKAFEVALRKVGGNPEPITTGLLLRLDKFDPREDGKFIPHPATWLNQERWTDGEDTPRQPPAPDRPLH